MRLPAISLNAKDLANLGDALKKEWLVTNGLGGYSSSTILDVNTRKYHGLLVAALHPPGDRTICVSKLDEDIIVGDSIFRLGANEFQSGFFPAGYVFLQEFQVAPFPKHVYAAGNVTVEKTVFMPHGKNASAALYKFNNLGTAEVKVRIFPLLTCRHFHSVINENTPPLNLKQMAAEKSVELTSDNPTATIAVAASEGTFVEKPTLVRHLFYREEASRGESSLDDLHQPGYFETSLLPRESRDFAVVAAADVDRQVCRGVLESVGTTAIDVERYLELELKRRVDSLANFYDSQKRVPASDSLSWILQAADSFIARGNGDSRSVIAGYHWFEEWGRDTFISLPGLLLATGRFADAERVLVRFSKYVKRGLIPNFIPNRTGQEQPYNTVDATLWYLNAVLQYLKYTGDFRFVEENLWETIKTIIENHERGTAFGIHLDSDGLLSHGPRLTWMDAETNGEAVTPRAGKAVEVQALWYNALRTVQLLATKFGPKSLSWRCSDTANRARESFDWKFWNRDKRCLFDVLEASGANASVRPNQIIAVALDFPIIYQDKAEAIVDLVQRELFTPFGLRTLAQGDVHYRGVYDGNRARRDNAYHNGTVWPWLLGPFVSAFLKTKGTEGGTREYALTNILMPLFSTQVLQSGLGTVNEIFDGDPPHTPRGCISQAWSVAEPLRAYVEDILQVRPKFEKEVLQL